MNVVPRPRNGLSLCAGGGGLDMGLMLAEPGFHTRCYVEWEEYPRSVLIAAQRAGYLADAPIWSDLTTFDATPFAGAFDTLLAGYPCQPFSAAGQRKGEDDERHLWPDVARVARELGPGLRWCFFENVAGHVSLGLETVLRELWQMGFTPAVGLFTAAETGAAHERERVFIVAYRSGERGGEQDDAKRTLARRDARGGAGRVGLRLHGELADPDGGTPAMNGNSAAGNSDFTRKADLLAETVLNSLWGTPRASDGEKGGPNQSFGAGGTPLPAQAAQWPTPASRDWKGENSTDHLTNGTGRLHLGQLPNFVAHCFTPPAQRRWTSGVPSSMWRPISRRLFRSAMSSVSPTVRRRWLRKGAWRKNRLNPSFVEWLMSWPPGHSHCDCSVMAYIHWQQEMRGALSQMPTASGPWIWSPPLSPAPLEIQIDLFAQEDGHDT